MLLRFKFLLFAIIVAVAGNAQQDESQPYIHQLRGFGNSGTGTGTLSTGNSGTGANIDVVYHRCNWTANPDDLSKTLTGSITTYFKTLAANVAAINFDFNKTSFNNASLSVQYHGSNCSFSFPSTGNQDVLNIQLPVNIANAGTLDSVTINYQGIPPAPNGNAEGYQLEQDDSGNNYLYTLSESYEDKDWWPCKADMQDKIDSLDISVTVPAAFWVAANGIMTDSSVNGTNRIFKFKHRYPIASYLVAIGIAKFIRYDLGTLPAGIKNVPFVFNMFPDKSAAIEAYIMNVLNNHKKVFAAFNNLYGDYPFANEKHGFYEFGYSGGMEHQTFSGIGGYNLQSNSVLAHELAHQWWGDKVCFATWKHLWLAEGFANYSEVLMAEFVPSIGINATTKLGNNKNTARSLTSTAMLLSNIANSNTVWTNNNTTAVYNRGCMVASMLRALMGDNKFFAACKNYLNDTALAYKSATSSDLQHHMETAFGESMSGFFTEWVTKKGVPDYNIQWGNQGNKVNISLNQTVNSSGSSGTASVFFPMPVVLTISNAGNTIDTTITIYHKAPKVLMYSGDGVGAIINDSIISFNLSFTPATITLDPLSKTMADGTVTYNSLLATHSIELVAKNNGIHNLLTLHITGNDIPEKVELEKSVDGIHFFSVNKMGIVEPDKVYELNDIPLSTKTYYRAKLHYHNSVMYSNIAIVNRSATIQLSVSPNPAQKEVTIVFDNKESKEYIVTLVSVLGKRILTKNVTANTVTLDIHSISAGVYVVELLQNGGLVGSKKLIVKR